MITRPLNLASHLRPSPKNFDFLFVVNAGLLALFFSVFGSRFVLSPGLPVDFKIPQMSGATAGANVATHQITITMNASGVILVDDGLITMDQLRPWLKRQTQQESRESRRAESLNILADARVPMAQVSEVASAATDAGFVRVSIAALEPAGAKREGK